jgi:DNA-binding transcriptional regulator YdaS (Cro superfamily)
MKKILLVVEKSTDDHLWGRVDFEDNLIVDDAPSLPQLQKKMKDLLHDFHDLKPATVDFEVAYDLGALFDVKKYLNLSELASRLGINRSLMAQYASGTKYPSLERAQKIEEAIHELGRDLLEIKLALNGQDLKKSKTIAARKKSKQKTKA